MKLKAASFLSLLVLVLASAVAARAQGEQAIQPPRYRMELIHVMDGDKGEYVFLIGAVGFKTIEGLKDFVARLPHGSVIEWAPGCLRRGDEPLLSSAEEMEAWQKFCAEHGIEFILVPSG